MPTTRTANCVLLVDTHQKPPTIVSAEIHSGPAMWAIHGNLVYMDTPFKASADSYQKARNELNRYLRETPPCEWIVRILRD